MCIYIYKNGYVCMCLCVHTYIPLPGKLDFSYLVTILKCQDLAKYYIHDWSLTYIFKM